MSRFSCSLCALLLAGWLFACDAGVQFSLSKAAPPASPSPSSAAGSSSLPSSSELSYVSYLRQYRKVYTAADFQRRFAVFSANVALIEQHNANQSSTHRLGVTEHADWTAAEFRQYRLGYHRPEHAKWSEAACDSALYSHAKPATSQDWRASSAVSGVKNQGETAHSTHTHTACEHPPRSRRLTCPSTPLPLLLWCVVRAGQCGACWSFAATGSVEGLWAIRNSQLLSLSEQQLLDCSGTEGNQGCSGGYTSSALQYVVDNGGLCGEADYSYIGYPGTASEQATDACRQRWDSSSGHKHACLLSAHLCCLSVCLGARAAGGGADSQCHDECSILASIDSHSCVPALNESALLQALTLQPIAVAIEADQSIFQHYTGGVIDDPKCGQQLDHAVLLIGYGTDSATGQDYYVVKNSWGTGWGIQGYALVARGKNMCGIAAEPVFPVMAATNQTAAE